jgi:hypothetical protein
MGAFGYNHQGGQESAMSGHFCGQLELLLWFHQELQRRRSSPGHEDSHVVLCQCLRLLCLVALFVRGELH